MADLLTAPTAAPGAAPSPPRARPRRARRNTLIGWSFILPNFLGFALLTLVPVAGALALSFMEWDSYNPPEWVGLDNFERLLRDESTMIALRNTAYYALGHVPLTMLAALGLALLLNRRLRGVGFFRAAAFFPYVTSLVAVAIVWNMLFNPEFGPVNQFLSWLGVDSPPGWTTSVDWAMPAVILTSVWRDMGYYMVLFLAGLQAIPTEHHEAARVDGANAWQRFRAVTLPGLRPVTFLVLILLTVQSFKVFDLVVVMTDGGPGRATLVLSQQIYRRGIIEGEFGYASAISLVLFLLVLVLTLTQFWFNNRRERS
ncbi:carbohydrate ABC transporter permease [Catellatospora bangladeshensis]|uniref:ABC transporter permease n=1 Tax=Catellatospora bangladeshensis TaxID=310355 RepID=A0A8J3NK77_9ACTN|nr:sugar ABC transporter permease [Catellatospora bangladeshensis]GIF82331.1 ABC transporter permease [Catellatospora bangladeshensis]